MHTKPRKTKTDEVYERMRADIFAARLRPGQRLKFPELCGRYETSVGVAREALARLAAEQLVRPQAHVGYAVVSLSQDELEDLTTARIEIESLALRHSIADGTMEWEAGLVASHHVLSRLGHGGEEPTDAYLGVWHQAHEEFHRALLAGCANRHLRATAQSLRDRAELYRHWVVPFGDNATRDVAGEHQALLDAVLARQTDRAMSLLQAHIARTTQALIAGFASAVEPVREVTP